VIAARLRAALVEAIAGVVERAFLSVEQRLKVIALVGSRRPDAVFPAKKRDTKA
jgi:hypothetical protein